MLTTKIDFLREEFELDEHTPSVEIPKWDSSQSVTEQEVVSETYYVHSMFNGVTGKVEHFLIKHGDKDLFDSFLQITNSRINQVQMKAKHEGYGLGVTKGKQFMKVEIKLLPWWKRLFNKF